jgi:hypothetical protein
MCADDLRPDHGSPVEPGCRLRYKLSTIRKLLRDAFTAATLWRLCQEHPTLRPALTQFEQNPSLDGMIDVLIEYCRTQDLFSDLLGAVEAANPRQFARYRDDLFELDLPVPPHLETDDTRRLAEGVSALVQRVRASPAEPGGGPYKGLLEYRRGDAGLFFGREQAIRALREHLDRGPLTVLHSESGAGKTSLLQAGLSPQLIAAGHLPVYLRPYNTNPVLAVKKAFLGALGFTPGLAAAPLHEFLCQVCDVLDPPPTFYLLIDQFEEFFIHRVPRRPQPEGLLDAGPPHRVLWPTGYLPPSHPKPIRQRLPARSPDPRRGTGSGHPARRPAGDRL